MNNAIIAVLGAVLSIVYRGFQPEPETDVGAGDEFRPIVAVTVPEALSADAAKGKTVSRPIAQLATV